MVVCIMMLCCTAVGEDQYWEEHTVSEFRVEVKRLIPEVRG